MQKRTPDKYLHPLLGPLVAFALLLLTTQAKATYIVFDPTNWTENVLQYVEHVDQTAIQNTISSTETTISQITNTIRQYTQYISKLENLIQQATGTVTGTTSFINGLYSQIASIPSSFQNAFQSILNIPNAFSNKGAGWGINAYANSTDPISRYLGSALAVLQRLTSALNNGGTNGNPYSPSRYAANMNQAFAAQTLKNAPDAATTITTLQNNAGKATTLEAGQAASNMTGIQDLAARNQGLQMQAASNIYEVQNKNVLNQYKNNITAGKEQAGLGYLYGGFNP